MRCKEAKARIKKLERENFKLRKQSKKASPEDRHYDFNLLEIEVRARHNPTLIPIFGNDSCKIDMRVIGCQELNVPTICTYKVIQKAAIHFLRENKRDFMFHMGEIMAHELLEFADKNVSEIAE